MWGVVSLSGMEVAPDLRKIDPSILFRSTPGAISALQSTPAQEPPVPVLIRLASDDDALPDQVRNLGGTAQKIHPRIYAARLPEDATRYLSHRPAVLYMEPDRVVWPLLDVSRPAVSADIIQQGLPPLPQSFRGDNTFVGIVDTGLSGTHPDFAGRIAHTFSVSPALDPLEDTNGHGTHVTGIAAGDGAASAGTYTGLAPGSQLLIGRAGAENFQTSTIIAAINDFLLFAGATPVSINLSLGLFLGPHDGTSNFEFVVNSLATGTAGSKRIITVAAGNERISDEHFRTTVPPFGIVNQVVDFASGTTFVDIQIWADGDDEYSVTATMGTESINLLSGTAGTSPTGRISIGNKSSTPPNGDTLIFLTFQPPPGTGTAGIRLTRTRNGGTGTVDGYIDNFEGTFSGASEAGTISEPANADAVIAVGSYNTKLGHFPTGSLDALSSFSSFGPTRDGRIKPDIVAPGSFIWSTRSLAAPESNYHGIVDNNYAILAGTSMSAPHVAGIASLVWESNPALTGAQMRERLKRTADLQTPTPDTTWGHGKVNTLTAITETVAGISGPARTLPGQNLTLRADEKSSGPYGNSVTYFWTAPGALIGSPTEASTTFTANAPGDYPVTLTAAPGSAPYNQASTTIRVNNVPTASISGPAAADNVTSIPFTGTGLDADGQSLSFHWILLARPSTSSSVLTTENVDNVALVPDLSGTYELGLRVNDGLDDSALATHTVTVALAAGSSGGGGGGCVIGSRNSEEDDALSLAALLLFPLLSLPARKMGYRLLHNRRPASSNRN